jgi:hypothetical protein
MRFEILSDSTVIGYSELELGDAPMGVAGGVFVPLAAYGGAIKAACVNVRDSSQAHLALSARLVGGLTLPAVGGVQVLDFSDELGLNGIEVHVVGIPYPMYRELFPKLVEAYEQQFAGPG